MKIGLNILGGGDYNEPALLAWLDRARPTACVVMDNSDLAMRLQARYPSMLVIYRAWPDDNIPTKHPDPAVWVRWIASYVPDPRILLYAGNEPSHDAALAYWTVGAINEADRIGRRLVVVNSGMGGPEDSEWRKELAPLLYALHASNQRRAARGLPLHPTGLHEYYDFHDWQYPGYDPLAGGNWLIGRFRRMWDACDELGVARPPVIITEHGSDSLDARWHGWLAGDAISAADYADALIAMDRRVYNDPLVLGQCIFCWNGHAPGWSTFDVSGAPELLNRLAAYAESAPETEGPNMTERTTVTVQPLGGYANIRDEPNGQDIGDLRGEHIAGMTVDSHTVAGYTWHHYEFADDTPDGWIAFEVVKVEPHETPQPDPEPEPEPEPTPDPEPDPVIDPVLFKQQWQTLLTAFDVLSQHIVAALTAERHTNDTLQSQIGEFRAILQETIAEADDLVVQPDAAPTLSSGNGEAPHT